MDQKTEAVLAVAQKAWEDYVFPEGIDVAGADGWSYELPMHGKVTISRKFYLEPEEGEGSILCFFDVDVDSDAVALKDVCALTDKGGNMIGHPGGEVAEAEDTGATPQP